MSSHDPEIFFGDDGAPRSARFGDIYYSLDGGLAESQAVFLSGCELPQAWLGRKDFCILELGFGTGLNILALIDLWLKHRPDNGQLRLFSIEAYLMHYDHAKAALDHFPQLAEFSRELLGQWPQARFGLDYIEFPKWGVTLTIAQMDVIKGLHAFGHMADAVFLDGFSPKLNPEMWSEEVMALIAERCRKGARLATFTVAGIVRNALTKAGFSVKKCAGFGKKRERLEAIFEGNAHVVEARKQPQKIAIIGAGIAGACLYRQASNLGIDITLFEASSPASGASGNRVGLLAPRLDSGENKAVRLISDAFKYALRFYETHCARGIIGRGVYQLAKDERDMTRFSKITHHANYAANSFELFHVGDLDELPKGEGLILQTALHIAPNEIVTTLLQDAKIVIGNIIDVTNNRVELDTGDTYSGFDAIILANGEGIFDYIQSAYLRPVHGQVEYLKSQDKPKIAFSWGGYCVPDKEGFVFGATHDRDIRGNQTRTDDLERNLSLLSEAMPEFAARINQEAVLSRASTRVMSLDIMPVIGEISPGLWVLTGLGSRGFCTAPLMAKWILQLISGQGIDAHADVMKSVFISRFEAARSS